MLNPNSSHKLAWDWLVVCLVVFTTLSTPLDLALFDTDCSAPNALARPAAPRRDLVLQFNC